MKRGNAQFIVLTELVVLLLLESKILNKLIIISRLAFTGNASTPVLPTKGTTSIATPIPSGTKGTSGTQIQTSTGTTFFSHTGIHTVS